MDYLLHLIVLTLIYGMVAVSLNIGSGLTRLISLAQAGFFGVGAYTTAILATRYEWPFWVNLPVAMMVTGLVALPVARIALRTIDDYFVLSTLAMGVLLFSVMNNWTELTNGPNGITRIPGVSVFGHKLSTKLEWVLLSTAFYIVVFWVARNIKGSAYGRILVGISEDEIFCQSLGKDTGLAKFQSFCVGALLASIPGVLYAHFVSFIDPKSFTVNESIFILSIVIIGGMGNLWGSLAASTFMIFLPEALRFAGLPTSIAANIREVFYGMALIFVLWFQHNARQVRNSLGSAAEFSQP